jgi:hypothetical protein
MSYSFKQIPMSEMRVKLPKLRRLVQLGKQRIVVTYYGEIIGFLLPIDDLANDQIPITASEEMPLTKFRDRMTEAWELLQSGIDCIYLTFHNRRVLAFLSPKLSQYLSLPIIGDADKIFFLPTQESSIFQRG